MRTCVGVALVTVCLGLAGCSLFGKKQSAQNANPKPFLGSEAPARRETAADDSRAPLPGTSGMLAGRVLDKYTGRPAKVYIEVKNLDDSTTKAAKLEVWTKEDGYFTIPGLKPGGHYQLIARAQEGSELASGIVYARPPDPRLSIWIDKNYTTPNTPAVPEPPGLPKKNGSGAGGRDSAPATTLESPIKIPAGKDPPAKEGSEGKPSSSGMGANPGGDPSNISNVADGFAHTPRSPTIDIPRPGQYRSLPWPPPPPEWQGVRDERPTQPSTGPGEPLGPPPSVRVPDQPTRVPSCVLVGSKLENFALNDQYGHPWEYRKHREGRLVLLDFWYSTCTPCLAAIPHLVQLQRNYGRYGLQVIGISCERGTEHDQVERVRGARGRYLINYKTLLFGGYDRCPVLKQFQVTSFPTLVLLDESGKIIWRSDPRGLDDYGLETLDRLIQQRLNVRPR